MSPSKSKRRPILAAFLGALVVAPSVAAAAAPAFPSSASSGAASGALPAQYRQTPPQGYGQGAQRAPSVDEMLGSLRQRLRLNASQLPAFNAFAAVMRENAREAQGMPAPNQNADAVQALRAELRFTRAELQGLRRLLPALQALYARLSPAQRRTADAFFRQGPEQR